MAFSKIFTMRHARSGFLSAVLVWILGFHAIRQVSPDFLEGSNAKMLKDFTFLVVITLYGSLGGVAVSSAKDFFYPHNHLPKQSEQGKQEYQTVNLV